MKSQKERSLKDFISHKGEYSSGRLVFLIGSFVILSEFIANPESMGVQNLVMAIMGYAAAATTISKFSKQEQYGNEPTSIEEVWDAECEQPEHGSMGRPKRTRNRSNS
jgi:hypothetical protein